jgi:hypothetical protein
MLINSQKLQKQGARRKLAPKFRFLNPSVKRLPDTLMDMGDI